jgi:hypothetical protein
VQLFLRLPGSNRQNERWNQIFRQGHAAKCLSNLDWGGHFPEQIIFAKEFVMKKQRYTGIGLIVGGITDLVHEGEAKKEPPTPSYNDKGQIDGAAPPY